MTLTLISPHWFAARLVVPGLVPGIHVLAELRQERRGWPGRSPAMTKKTKACSTNNSAVVREGGLAKCTPPSFFACGGLRLAANPPLRSSIVFSHRFHR